MRTTLLAVLLLAGCGGKKANTDAPVYTPAMANSIRGLAPVCELQKNPNVDDVIEIWGCRGAQGTVTVALTEGDRVRRIDVKLRSMTAPEAKVHLKNSLGPLAGPPLTDQLMGILDKLTTGARDSAEQGTARLEVVAAGTSKIAPEYAISVSW